MNRASGWLPILTLVAVLGGGCASLPFVSHVPSLAYSHDPGVKVLSAYEYPLPNVPTSQFFFCNEAPSLQIWGDGRTVRRGGDPPGGALVAGRLDPADIDALLTLLARRGFFDPPPPGSNPSPGGGPRWYITLTLPAGEFRGDDWANGRFFDDLLRAVPADHFSPFVPRLGLLVAKELEGIDNVRIPPGTSIPDWPARFGSALRDAATAGQWIQGDTLAYAWGVVNGRRETPYPLIREGGTTYLVAVRVPGVTQDDSSVDCLGRPIPPAPGAGP
jgi:hypothetical protein